MKKLMLSKETVRKLDDDTLEKIVGGWPPANLTKNCDNTTVGACGMLTNCVFAC